ARQLLEIGKAEAHEELLGGAIENRAADDFLAARGGDEALFEKRLDDAADIDAADFVDFGRGDGLLIGDDGERLERRHREANGRLKAFDEFADDVVVLGLGVQLPAAGNFADFDAAFVGGMGGDEQVERGADFALFEREGVRELIERGGLVRGIDDGFECGLEFLGRHRVVIGLEVLLLDFGHRVGTGEYRLEHFMLAKADIGEKRGLHQQHGLHAHHFEHGEERNDHGVAGFASVKEFDERDDFVGGDEALAEAVHHLRDGDAFMAQGKLGDVFFALEDVLEGLDEIHERNDEFAFDFFTGVERAVWMRPDVLLDLLLLIKELRGILEFFVLEEAMNEFIARVFGFARGGERIGGQQHLRLDVDERGRDIDEIRGDVYIERFELVEIIEILLGDFGDGNIVDVHLLLANQIEQKIERAFVGG